MVLGMATTKVTITLDEADVQRVREVVAAGKAANVSGFVQRAVKVAFDAEAELGAMLAGALEQTGGPLTGDERAWADAVIQGKQVRARPPKRRKAA
jgi:Arc/MetJ-type ribon-helix-helix transcriptional regulator